MAPSTVIKLEEHRRRKEFDALLSTADPEGLFTIPFDDISHYLDTANESKNDPVTLGARAVVALKRLFTPFGIDEMPATMGELLGALWYCKSVQSFVNQHKTDPENDALWEQSVDNTLEEYAPELLRSVRALRQGDVATLRRIHAEQMPLAEMSDYYDVHRGWACGLKKDRPHA